MQVIGEEVSIRYIRDGEEKSTSMEPVKTGNKEYKLGLWVRDTAAGVGTVTFYDPQSGTFGALGHGILDIDTGKLIDIAKGEAVTSQIVSITKGQKGTPGEIRGTIQNGVTIGEVYKNTEFGIYGKLNQRNKLDLTTAKEVEVMSRNEIKTGKATILCSLEDGKKEEYEIEIQKVYLNNNQDNKSMMIKVTDERFLEKTGGIIQGMSGSPILQDGKLVGAVTNVLVSDPTTGYGIFADMMLKQAKEVE